MARALGGGSRELGRIHDAAGPRQGAFAADMWPRMVTNRDALCDGWQRQSLLSLRSEQNCRIWKRRHQDDEGFGLAFGPWHFPDCASGSAKSE